MKKIKNKNLIKLFLIRLICLVIACVLTFVVVKVNRLLEGEEDIVQIALYCLRWAILFYALLVMLTNVLITPKILDGRSQEILFIISANGIITFAFSYALFALIKGNFKITEIDWFLWLKTLVSGDGIFILIACITLVVVFVFYFLVIDRRLLYWTKTGIRGFGPLKQIDSNLENSRWMSEAETKKLFKTYNYADLKKVKKDGVPVKAVLDERGKKLSVSFNSPCHSIVIGSTGSGKTTTFVSPMIQLLGATSAGSSMVITDPKGELFSLHSKFLADNGYDVKVIDLRDTYSSYRWNPLDGIWDNYQRHLYCHKEAFAHNDSEVDKTKFKLADPEESFANLKGWYEFNGMAYSDYHHMIDSIKVLKKKLFDEVYEDLNDLVSILIPIDNPKDPLWEKGARSIVLATLLAMLEDSADPELHMTKDKFNFFNMTKILQNSSNDYFELKNYFAGRSVTSKAVSLSKQVCDCAESTRSSYMSIVYEKLTLFNDTGICAMTSASDFSSEQLAHKPTALFLKIPDEKDTRHNLASIFILNIYKTLIKVASATEELTLDRNVYFIMDEFGNMPKIEKFDKFITVGRSRKIWFIMIIQSYAQLNNVYGDTVADIVKGNCGIKMFIGSNDMNTCKEYSELCGNITVVTNTSSGSVNSTDMNISSQTQVRPLIYPSDLQRLNHPGDIGHSIIVTFGNYPLKTYFSPSFNVPMYKTGKMNTNDVERVFEEKDILYSAKDRNQTIINRQKPVVQNADNSSTGGKTVQKPEREEVKVEVEKPDETSEMMDENKIQTDKLMKMWNLLKEKYPDLTLRKFFGAMALVQKEKTHD